MEHFLATESLVIELLLVVSSVALAVRQILLERAAGSDEPGASAAGGDAA